MELFTPNEINNNRLGEISSQNPLPHENGEVCQDKSLDLAGSDLLLGC